MNSLGMKKCGIIHSTYKDSRRGDAVHEIDLYMFTVPSNRRGDVAA